MNKTKKAGKAPAKRKTLNISEPSHMTLSKLALVAQGRGLKTNKQGLMEGMIEYFRKNNVLLEQIV